MRYSVALFLSLAFHGLLLLLPLPDRPASSEQPESQETIALTDLLASPVPRPPRTAAPRSPLPAPAAQLRATPPIAAQPPVSRPPAVAHLAQPSPAVAPTPSPAPPAPTPGVASPIPAPAAMPTPQPAASPDRVQSFFDEVSAATGVPVNPPSPDLFADPSLYFDAVEPEPILKPAILRAVWMAGKTPEQVYISVLSSQLQSGNFQTEQKPDYGGGTVYEIQQGESVWYLNLVPTRDNSGTILVVWQQDPSRPASTS